MSLSTLLVLGRTDSSIAAEKLVKILSNALVTAFGVEAPGIDTHFTQLAIKFTQPTLDNEFGLSTTYQADDSLHSVRVQHNPTVEQFRSALREALAHAVNAGRTSETTPSTGGCVVVVYTGQVFAPTGEWLLADSSLAEHQVLSWLDAEASQVWRPQLDTFPNIGDKLHVSLFTPLVGSETSWAVRKPGLPLMSHVGARLVTLMLNIESSWRLNGKQVIPDVLNMTSYEGILSFVQLTMNHHPCTKLSLPENRTALCCALSAQRPAFYIFPGGAPGAPASALFSLPGFTMLCSGSYIAQHPPVWWMMARNLPKLDALVFPDWSISNMLTHRFVSDLLSSGTDECGLFGQLLLSPITPSSNTELTSELLLSPPSSITGPQQSIWAGTGLASDNLPASCVLYFKLGWGELTLQPLPQRAGLVFFWKSTVHHAPNDHPLRFLIPASQLTNSTPIQCLSRLVKALASVPQLAGDQIATSCSAKAPHKPSASATSSRPLLSHSIDSASKMRPERLSNPPRSTLPKVAPTSTSRPITGSAAVDKHTAGSDVKPPSRPSTAPSRPKPTAAQPSTIKTPTQVKPATTLSRPKPTVGPSTTANRLAAHSNLIATKQAVSSVAHSTSPLPKPKPTQASSVQPIKSSQKVTRSIPEEKLIVAVSDVDKPQVPDSSSLIEYNQHLQDSLELAAMDPLMSGWRSTDEMESDSPQLQDDELESQPVVSAVDSSRTYMNQNEFYKVHKAEHLNETDENALDDLQESPTEKLLSHAEPMGDSLLTYQEPSAPLETDLLKSHVSQPTEDSNFDDHLDQDQQPCMLQTQSYASPLDSSFTHSLDLTDSNPIDSSENEPVVIQHVIETDGSGLYDSEELTTQPESLLTNQELHDHLEPDRFESHVSQPTEDSHFDDHHDLDQQPCMPQTQCSLSTPLDSSFTHMQDLTDSAPIESYQNEPIVMKHLNETDENVLDDLQEPPTDELLSHSEPMGDSFLSDQKPPEPLETDLLESHVSQSIEDPHFNDHPHTDQQSCTPQIQSYAIPPLDSSFTNMQDLTDSAPIESCQNESIVMTHSTEIDENTLDDLQEPPTDELLSHPELIYESILTNQEPLMTNPLESHISQSLEDSNSDDHLFRDQQSCRLQTQSYTSPPLDSSVTHLRDLTDSSTNLQAFPTRHSDDIGEDSVDTFEQIASNEIEEEEPTLFIQKNQCIMSRPPFNIGVADESPVSLTQQSIDDELSISPHSATKDVIESTEKLVSNVHQYNVTNHVGEPWHCQQDVSDPIHQNAGYSPPISIQAATYVEDVDDTTKLPSDSCVMVDPATMLSEFDTTLMRMHEKNQECVHPVSDLISSEAHISYTAELGSMHPSHETWATEPEVSPSVQVSTSDMSRQHRRQNSDVSDTDACVRDVWLTQPKLSCNTANQLTCFYDNNEPARVSADSLEDLSRQYDQPDDHDILSHPDDLADSSFDFRSSTSDNQRHHVELQYTQLVDSTTGIDDNDDVNKLTSSKQKTSPVSICSDPLLMDPSGDHSMDNFMLESPGSEFSVDSVVHVDDAKCPGIMSAQSQDSPYHSSDIAVTSSQPGSLADKSHSMKEMNQFESDFDHHLSSSSNTTTTTTEQDGCRSSTRYEHGADTDFKSSSNGVHLTMEDEPCQNGHSKYYSSLDNNKMNTVKESTNNNNTFDVLNFGTKMMPFETSNLDNILVRDSPEAVVDSGDISHHHHHHSWNDPHSTPDLLARDNVDITAPGVERFDPFQAWGQPQGLPAPVAPGAKAAAATSKYTAPRSSLPNRLKASSKPVEPTQAKSTASNATPTLPAGPPVFLDLIWVPTYLARVPRQLAVEFFARVRAHTYVLSGDALHPMVGEALIEGKAKWKSSDVEQLCRGHSSTPDSPASITILPTDEPYDWACWLHTACGRLDNETGKSRLELSGFLVLPAASLCDIEYSTGSVSFRCEGVRVDF